MTGKIRIISGQWRGRKLPVVDRPGLRPSGDRSREVLFNWLQGRVAGRQCLDLFAGTGALGLEAASRGAASVTLIERDRALADSLRAIAAQWPGGDRVEIVHGDALGWMESARDPFDLVFIDPPFDSNLYAQALEALLDGGLLAEQARVYVESPADRTAPVVFDQSIEVSSSPCQADALARSSRWRLIREKTIGAVRMQLLSVS